MLRSSVVTLIFVFFYLSLSAQTPLPPEAHGGNPSYILNLRNPAASTLLKTTEEDFSRQNPRFRSFLPKERMCIAPEMEADIQIQHADESESKDSFEVWLDETIKYNQATRSLSRKIAADEILTLPVVIHVIYSNPTENISDEQIFSQIEVLNQDYRRTNPDQDRTAKEFKKVATDTGIEFCLATVDPSGKPTTGINRISMSGSPFSERHINEIIKPATIWNTDRYLNIWVCNIAGGILGYAQFPVSSGLTGLPGATGRADADGVVISYNTFGTTGTVVAPFDKGRTATHEIGHWLGLRHVWGDGPCGTDDFCKDTPETGQATFACPPGVVGCSGANAMIQNYMDYTDDACMNLFTADQRLRMRAVLENSPRRKNLINSTACIIAKTPPEPAFVADIRAGCGPLTINFTSTSLNDPESFEWSFPGGKPSISDKNTQKVVYRQAGIYPVSLRVANTGGNRTLLLDEFVQVYETGKPLPLEATFDGGQKTLPEGFLTHNPNNDETWALSEKVGGRGKSNGSIWLNNYENNLKGSADWLLTPVMDFSKGTHTQISFDIAYAMFDEKYSDTLGIFISTGCDAVFRNIYYKGGKNLMTSAPQTRSFTPLAEEWRTEIIDLSEFDGQSFVQIAIVGFSGHGNDLFLDNLKISSKPFPAPVADFSATASTVCAGGTLTFTDKSLNEPSAWIWSFPGANPASDTTPNPTVTFPAPGIYDVMLTVTGRGGSHTVNRTGFVVVKPRPELKLLSTKTDICLGEEITLTASGLEKFEWDLKGDAPSPSGYSVTLKPKNDVVYTITGTGDVSCSATASLAIRVRQTRPLTITPPVVTICQGGETGLNATGAQSYTWAPAAGLSNTSSGFVKVSPRQTTTYQVIGLSDNGCELKSEVIVTVEETPRDFVISASRPLICPGEKTLLTASGAAGYEWSPTTGLNTTVGAEVMANPSETTTYTVTATTQNGCSFQKKITVQVAPRPDVRVAAGISEVCQGQSVRLSASGAEAFLWSPKAYLDRLSGPSVEAKPEVNATFSVVGSNAYGCLDTAKIDIDVFQAPPLVIDASRKVICRGSNVNLTARGSEYYTWESAPGLGSVSQNQAVVSPSTTQTYRVTGVDQNGCLSRGEITVQVADGFRPVADFSVDNSFSCAGQEMQFRSTSEGAVDFFWEFPKGSPATSSDPNPRVKFMEEGIQDVVLTVRGCNGQTDRKTALGEIVITSPFELSLNVTGDVTVCRDEPFRLEALGASGYSWSPAIGLDKTEGRVVFARPEQTTTYTVTASDAQGCQASKSVTLFVSGRGNQLKVSPFAPVICSGESVTLSATGATSYEWSPREGLKTSSVSSVVASPTKTTTYKVVATDLDGCVFTDTVRVEVRQRKSLVIEPPAPVICAGSSVKLRAGGSGVYNWSPSEGLSSAMGYEIEAFPGQTTTYVVEGIDEQGCSSNGTVTVTVERVESLTVSAQDENICKGQATLLTAGGSSSYTWSPATGLDKTTGPIISAAPKETTTYTVTGGSAKCPQSLSVSIVVIEPQPLKITPETAQICEGGSARLEVSGGKTYIWNGDEGLSSVAGSAVSVTPAKTTSYSVMSVDSMGCETSGAVTVMVKTGDFLSATTSAARVCAGEEITLSAEGGDTYEWLPAPGILARPTARTYARPDTAVLYTVVGKDVLGCPDTASIKIEVSRIQADFDLSTHEIDLAESTGLVRFTDKTEGSVAWIWDFGIGSTSRQQNPNHIYAEAGTYIVTLRVSDGVCEDIVQKEIRVKNSSSLEDITDLGEINISPKPVNGKVDLVMNSPRKMYLRMRLLNDAGFQLLSGALRIKAGEYRQQLDLTGFDTGIYHLQLTDGVETFTRSIDYKP
ncbi:MAG: PKD domain-containing protein [Bacteroidia bacterium]|nr:PKD domain-containing protein [Bacteroidia bacterium]